MAAEVRLVGKYFSLLLCFYITVSTAMLSIQCDEISINVCLILKFENVNRLLAKLFMLLLLVCDFTPEAAVEWRLIASLGRSGPLPLLPMPDAD